MYCVCVHLVKEGKNSKANVVKCSHSWWAWGKVCEAMWACFALLLELTYKCDTIWK